MSMLKWFLIGSTAGMLGACAKDQPTVEVRDEVVATPTPHSTNTALENEELQEKLSRLSTSLKALADTMSKSVERQGNSAHKDMAEIEAELDKVAEMIRKGADESQETGKMVFGKAVDEMDHLVKRMKETMD